MPNITPPILSHPTTAPTHPASARTDAAPRRLSRLDGRLIEVFCDCDPAPASSRFQRRVRHAGHLYPRLTREEAAERVATIRATYPGPLRLGGPLLIVDTNQPVDPIDVADQLRSLLVKEPPTV